MEKVSSSAAAIGGSTLGFVLAFVGCPLMWSLLSKSTENDNRYEGYMSAAGYHVFTMWMFPLFFAIAAAARAGKASANAARLVVVSLSLAMFYLTMAIGLPGNLYSFAETSFANYNAIRIADEETNSSDVQAAGYVRGALSNRYGLSDIRFTVDNGTVDEEDMQHTLGGMILISMGASIAYACHLGFPDFAVVGENAKHAVANSAASVFSMVALFLRWNTDAAADPTHIWYENVMGTAGLATFLMMISLWSALFPAQGFLGELGLFGSGAFGLTAPIRIWQMIALQRELEPAQDADVTDSEATAEVDRYRTAFVLITLAAIVITVNNVQAISARTAPAAATTSKITHALVGLGSILLIIGAAFMWHVVEESLDRVADDEKVRTSDDDNYRFHAANWYIVIQCFAGLCFAIQQYKPNLAGLWWTAAGIVTSTWLGFTNVGTHDRQLWHVDFSFAGINELRWYNNEDFVARRAVDVDEDTYDYAFSGVLLIMLSFGCFFFGMYKLPFCGEGAKPATKFTKAFNVVVILSVVSALIGMITLWTTENLVHVPIQYAVDTGAAAGSGSASLTVTSPKNMIATGGDLKGERYTLNYYSSVNAFGAPEAAATAAETFAYFETDPAWHYGVIFLFTAASWQGTVISMFCILFGCEKSTLFLMISGALLQGALVWSFLYGASESEGKKYCKDFGGGDQYPNEDDCRRYTNGFVWIFFQGVLQIIAGVMGGSHAEIVAAAADESEVADEEAAPAATEEVAKEVPKEEGAAVAVTSII